MHWLALVGFFGQKCLQHIMLAPGHPREHDVRCVICEKVDNVHFVFLGLTVRTSAYLALILSRPWLILMGKVVRCSRFRTYLRELTNKMTTLASERFSPVEPTLEKMSTRGSGLTFFWNLLTVTDRLSKDICPSIDKQGTPYSDKTYKKTINLWTENGRRHS